MEPVKCVKCGGKVCLCLCQDEWAAHCMDCDLSIGEPGFYDPCASSKKEAIKMWNELNKRMG